MSVCLCQHPVTTPNIRSCVCSLSGPLDTYRLAWLNPGRKQETASVLSLYRLGYRRKALCKVLILFHPKDIVAADGDGGNIRIVTINIVHLH